MPVEALEQIGVELKKAGVRLIEFEWCVDASEVEWEEADNESAREYMAEANLKGVAVLSEFHVRLMDDDERPARLAG